MFIGGSAMNKKERFIEFNSQLIYFVEWTTNAEKPLGNIVIVHGMAEHINRYQPFAESPIEKGIMFMDTIKEAMGLLRVRKQT